MPSKKLIFGATLAIVASLLEHANSMDHNNKIPPLKPLESLTPLEPFHQSRPTDSFREGQFHMRHEPKFDFLKLAVIWQPGHAYSDRGPSRPVFSLHGLWPTRKNGHSPTNCITEEEFNEDRLTRLIPALNLIWTTSWPDLNNIKLWRFQWIRHGTCTTYLPGFGTARDYFRNAIKMFARLSLNSKHEELKTKRSNTEPYDKTLLFDTFSNQNDRSYKIELRCAKNEKGLDYLVEIKFCFGLERGNKLKDCPKNKSNCGDQILLVKPIGER